MRILDLGCGRKKYPGAIGVDVYARSDADVLCDLDVPPYPFGQDTFDMILLDNVIEHLASVIWVMEEVHRIGKVGARVIIKVPFYASRWAWIDPTHRHAFTSRSFDYFDPSREIHRYEYSAAQFRVVRVAFDDGLRLVRWWDRAIARLANRWMDFYESRLAHWFPVNQLTFELEVLKGTSAGQGEGSHAS